MSTRGSDATRLQDNNQHETTFTRPDGLFFGELQKIIHSVTERFEPKVNIAGYDRSIKVVSSDLISNTRICDSI